MGPPLEKINFSGSLEPFDFYSPTSREIAYRNKRPPPREIICVLVTYKLGGKWAKMPHARGLSICGDA